MGEEEGDMVLSLNEATGRLEPHRVLALLDMGVKPVYRLTTASGKQLKTTLTHPYLTPGGWKRLGEIKAGEEVAVAEKDFSGGLFFEEGKQGSHNRPELAHNKNEHPADNFGFGLGNFSFQLSNAFFKTLFGNFQDSLLGSFLNLVKNLDKGLCPFITKLISQDLRYGNYCHLSSFLNLKKTYHIFVALSRLFSPLAYAESYLSEVSWDKIISIEPLGPTQVYDIEVEATHNFIAQGIVAHNTYSQRDDRKQTTGETGRQATGKETVSSALSSKDLLRSVRERIKNLMPFSGPEELIKTVAKREDNYLDDVKILALSLFSEKNAQDFRRWQERLKKLEKRYEKIDRDIEGYKRGLNQGALAYGIFSEYKEQFKSLHHGIMDMLSIYSDYRNENKTGSRGYLKEDEYRKAHSRAEIIWERWEKGEFSQEYFRAELLEEIIRLRKELKEKEGLADLKELYPLQKEFRKKLKSWIERELESSQEKLLGLFEITLYTNVFTQVDAPKKSEVLKKAIAEHFRTAIASDLMKRAAINQIAQRLVENRTLYDGSLGIGNLVKTIKTMEEARTILAEEIGAEIKPILKRLSFDKLKKVSILGIAAISIALSSMLGLGKDKYPPPKPEVKQEEQLRGISHPDGVLPKNGDEAKTPPEDVKESSQPLPTEIMTLVLEDEIPADTDSVPSEEEKERNRAIKEMEEQIEENLQRLQDIKAEEAKVKKKNEEGMQRLEEAAQEKQPLEKESPPDTKEKEWHKPLIDMEGKPEEAGPSSSEDLKYPMPPVDTSRKDHVGFSGNNFTTDWVASASRVSLHYLKERSFSRIDPFGGTFFPSSEKKGGVSLSIQGDSEWVIMVVPPGSYGINALVPPGYAIVSVETENKIERIGIYYDNNNKIWYIEYKEYPGKLRIEVKPLVKDDFQPVKIVDSQGNPLSWTKVRELVEGKIPQPILALLDQARNLSLAEKKKVIQEIMGLFTYSTNPLLNEALQESDFLTVIFKHYALQCQGACLLNALLSYLLDIPLEIWYGYLGDGDGNFYTPPHAYNRGPEGIEDATRWLSGRSPFYGLKDVTPEDWKKELRYLEERGARIKDMLSWQEEERKIEMANRKLAEDKNRLEQEPLEPKPFDVNNYQQLLKGYTEKLALLEKQKLDRGSRKKLVSWIKSLDFTEVKTAEQLLSRVRYVLEIIEIIEIIERSFPEEKEQTNSLKERTYDEFSSVLQEKRFALREPFLRYLENGYLSFNTFMERVDPDGNKQIIELSTGKVVLELPPHMNLQDYSQDRFIVSEDSKGGPVSYLRDRNGDTIQIYPAPSLRSLYKGILSEGNWLMNEVYGHGSGYTFLGDKGYEIREASLQGELILITYSPESGYRINGPWAEKQEINTRKYEVKPSVVFLPDGKWFIEADKYFGPVIEENEELRKFQDRILDLKYSRFSSDMWIAVISDKQDEQLMRFVGPLAKENGIEGIKLPKSCRYQIEISPNDKNLLLVWTADDKFWNFSGNIARQNNLEDTKLPHQPKAYIGFENNAVIEIATSKVTRLNNDEALAVEYHFIGLGAAGLGIEGKEYISSAYQDLLLQADNEERDIALLRHFPLWTRFPSLYKEAQSLASTLWKQGKATTSFFPFLSRGGVMAIFKDKDGGWGIGWSRKMREVLGYEYEYEYMVYSIKDERLKNLEVSEFGYLEVTYQTGDNSDDLETFRIPMQGWNDGDVMAIQEQGFPNWLTLRKLEDFYRISPQTDERRVDLRWENFAQTARDNPQEAERLFLKIIEYMQENKDNLPFFNHKETKKIIEDNQEVIVEASRGLAIDELAYFTRLLRMLGLNETIEKIVGELFENRSGERKDEEEIEDWREKIEDWREEIEDGVDLWLWKEVFDAYTEALKEIYKIKDDFLNPYNFQDKGQEAIQRFNRLLIQYLSKNEADYLLKLERVYKKISSWKRFPLKIGPLTGDALKEAIELLRKKSGIQGFSFDVEFSPSVRNNPVYRILTALRASPEIFKLSIDLFQKDSWKLRPPDYLEQLEKWKELNPQLNDIFPEFGADKTWGDFWEELKKEAVHDVLVLAFLIGLVSFGLSFLNDWVRKKETRGLFVGEKTEDMVKKVLEDNAWFNAQIPWVREFIEKIFRENTNLSEEELKQIDDFLSVLSDKERLIFNIALSIARQSPEKAEMDIGKRLLYLLPFMSAILALKGPLAFKERQEMNKQLNELVGSITEEVESRDIYERYVQIMRKYAKGGSDSDREKSQVEKTKTEKREFSSLEERIKQEIAEQKKVVGVPPRKYYPGANGYPLNKSGDYRGESNRMREYVPGDDLRSIDWKATARSDNEVIVRGFIHEVKIPISIISDLGGLADSSDINTWIKDWVNSFKVLFRDWRVNDKKGDYTLDKLIFVWPNGKFDLVDTRKLFNKHTLSFQEVSKQLVEILKEKYKLVQETSDTDSGGFELKRRFYTAEENRRYTQGLKAIVEEIIAKKQQDEIKGLNELLKGQDVYLVGFPAEQRNKIGALLKNGIRTIYWEGNQAKINKINDSASSALIGQASEVSGSNIVSDQVKASSSVIANNPGGIDLNPQNLNLEVIGKTLGATLQSFNPIPFDLQTFQGFSFQIISVQPADSWETVFGLSSKETEALAS